MDATIASPEASDVFSDDLAAIAKIDVIPKILEVVCQTTGLRFAAVARVTEKRWIACAVRDEISFGLQPGGELRVETTICDEVRASGHVMAIDQATEDHSSATIPRRRCMGSRVTYRCRSSGPMDGSSAPYAPWTQASSVRNPQIIGMFTLFANLIGFHLDAQERLINSEKALVMSVKMQFYANNSSQCWVMICVIH